MTQTPSTYTPTDERAHRLLRLLRRTWRRRRQAAAGLALLAGVTAAAGLGALLVWLESLLYLPPAGRSAAVLILIGTAVLTARSFHRPPAPFEPWLDAFCRKRNLSRLRDGLDLWRERSESGADHATDGPSTGISTTGGSSTDTSTTAPPPTDAPTTGDSPVDLADLAIRRNLEGLDEAWLQTELRSWIADSPERRRERKGALLLIPVLLIACFAVWAEREAAWRSLSFWQTYEPPPPWTYTVSPADTTLRTGDPLEATVLFGEDSATSLPEQVTLAVRPDGEENWRRQTMDRDGERTYRGRQPSVGEDIEWRIEMDNHRSAVHRARVRHTPELDPLDVTVEPPAYTGRDREERRWPFARLEALTGSQITVRGVASTAPAELYLNLVSEEDTTRVTMEPDGETEARVADFTLDGQTEVYIHMEDEEGWTNRDPYRFTLREQEDESPVVRILDPQGTLRADEAGEIEILFEADDDHGLSGAELRWEHRRAFSDQVREESTALPTPERGEPQLAVWDPEDLALRPRDEVSIRIRVYDNDPVHGPKAADSRPIELRLASMAERLERVGRQEEQTGERLDEVNERYRQMEESYESLREELRRQPVPDDETRQRGDELAEQQQAVEDEIRELDRQFRELQQEIGGNDRISEETRRAYEELRELFDELDDPAIREALEEMRRAMQDFSAAELEEAMQQYEFNEQLYRERIERTVELFQTLKMNSDLDRLAARFEDLGERLRSLAGEEAADADAADETASADPEEILHGQREVREESDPLAEQIDRLQEHRPRRGSERLRELREESLSELGAMTGQLDEMIRQREASGGEMSPGEQQAMNELAGRYDEQAEAFRQARAQMGGQQIQVNLRALENTFQRVVQLSEEQERILDRGERVGDGSPLFVGLARRQQNIDRQFGQVGETLSEILREVPSLSGQIARQRAEIGLSLGRTVDQLSERDRDASRLASRQSLAGLNRLASMLATAIDQLRQQQDGQAGGMSMDQMLEQMENLSGEQQEMNRQLQDLINDLQGERLTMDEAERLEQLAERQNELRRQLRELQQGGALQRGDRTLSELERIAEEMEASINEMRGGRTDPLMNDRQQNILTRMLDAQEAMQQQGESEEYEGETALEVDAPRPEDGYSPEAFEEELRDRLQDPEFTRFRQEYEELIRRYMERLRELNEE